jgi:thiamine phosphate synthase YjbQ (UPF0047 family)
MPAHSEATHSEATLTQTSLSIPIEDGAPVRGTWQESYLF